MKYTVDIHIASSCVLKVPKEKTSCYKLIIMRRLLRNKKNKKKNNSKMNSRNKKNKKSKNKMIKKKRQ